MRQLKKSLRQELFRIVFAEGSSCFLSRDELERCWVQQNRIQCLSPQIERRMKKGVMANRRNPLWCKSAEDRNRTCTPFTGTRS